MSLPRYSALPGPSGARTYTRLVEPVVSVHGLRKRYGRVDAVAGIDLEVQRGEIFAFLGPNGAGKTTTVEILEGFRARTAGEVSVLGVDPAHGDTEWRNRIGAVLQESNAEPGPDGRDRGRAVRRRGDAGNARRPQSDGRDDPVHAAAGNRHRRAVARAARAGRRGRWAGHADDGHAARPCRSARRVGAGAR